VEKRKHSSSPHNLGPLGSQWTSENYVTTLGICTTNSQLFHISAEFAQIWFDLQAWMCDGFLAGEHGLDSFGKWQNQTIRRELGEPGHTHAGSSFSRLSQEELDASADERAGPSRYLAVFRGVEPGKLPPVVSY